MLPNSWGSIHFKAPGLDQSVQGTGWSWAVGADRNGLVGGGPASWVN